MVYFLFILFGALLLGQVTPLLKKKMANSGKRHSQVSSEGQKIRNFRFDLLLNPNGSSTKHWLSPKKPKAGFTTMIRTSG